MCAPAPPPAPNPADTINAQTAANKTTAIDNAALNRVNQYTPYGSSTYTTSGLDANGIPEYNQTVNLSPEQQQLYNMNTQGQISLGQTALGQLGNLQNAYSTPFSFGGPNVTGSVANSGNIQGRVNNGDYSAQIKQAQDAAYKSQTQYLDPQFAQQGESLDAKLANQGLQVGDKAYDNSQDQFGRQKQAAYQGAQSAAVQAGDQEQNVLYGQDLSSGQFANSAQQQQFGQNLSAGNFNNAASAQSLSQALGLYNQPLNSYNALATGAQVANPTFNSVPTANVANTDVGGITNQGYQNQMSAFNASQQGINNLFSLGGSLGSAAILASDRRLKRDITRVGQTAAGIPTYTFRYIDQEPMYFGVMSDEVRHIPGAVVTMANGYDGVNYAVIP